MTGAPPPTAAPLTTEEDRQWASFAHLGGIIGFLPSLIIWLVFRYRGSFTNSEGKEALNFQITVAIAYIIGSILSVLYIGFFISLAAFVISVVFSILAYQQARNGVPYRYPYTLRLIK
jgi:uncharacterized protein